MLEADTAVTCAMYFCPVAIEVHTTSAVIEPSLQTSVTVKNNDPSSTLLPARSVVWPAVPSHVPTRSDVGASARRPDLTPSATDVGASGPVSATGREFQHKADRDYWF